MNTPTPRTDEARRIDNGDTRPLLDEMETMERELAAERARMADLVADLNDACITLDSAKNDCDDYAMQNTAFKLMAVRNVFAAMKEGAK